VITGMRGKRHWPLLVPLAVSAVLNSWAIGTIGWGNQYYAAAVRSMSKSWHAFIYGSFDRRGFVTVDKPPLSLWVQAVFVKVFGFHQLTLLVPQILAGCGAVGLVYVMLVGRWGRLAATVGAMTLAVTPMSVMVNHSNNTDAILVLAMTACAAATVRAVSTGRWVWLVAAAVLFGAAFTTKMLAAFPVLAALLVAFALGAPVVWRRRAPMLAAGLAMACVTALAWFAFVDLTPEDSRPYVGSSPTNSAFQLAFDRNGLGQVEGDNIVGPGRDGGAGPAGGGGMVGPPNGPAPGGNGPVGPPNGPAPGVGGPAPVNNGPVGPPNGPAPGGNGPVANGEPPGRVILVPRAPGNGQLNFEAGASGPLRLFNASLGTQIGWLVLPGLLGLVGAVGVLGWRRSLRAPTVVVPLIWFGVGAGAYSITKGIVHPYYVAGIAPPLAMLVGTGAGALRQRLHHRGWWILAGLGVAATGWVDWVISRRTGYDLTTNISLVVAAGGVVLAGWALATRLEPHRLMPVLASGLALAVPAAWTAGALKAGVSANIPYAATGEQARFGPPPTSTLQNALLDYLRTNRGDAKWLVAVPSAQTAAPIIIQTGDAVMALGGFSGGDPIIDPTEFDALTQAGDVRFVLVGNGQGPGNGGNSPLTGHIRQSCTPVPQFAATLFDCAPTP
jgi:4-amino-4-deoxy-L-arabinose transferase-like glycosyltransferase